MPRNVRNFWLEADIDGRTSRYTGGPQAASGGFSLTVKQRDDGLITAPLSIRGYRRGRDGKLVLQVFDAAGDMIYSVETDRDREGPLAEVRKIRKGLGDIVADGLEVAPPG